MFSLRIVNVDHYMSPPKPGLDLTYSQFRGSQIKSVPVIRIFGSTSSGTKTCLHVHGVFPHILVPYSGAEDAGRIMYQLASSIDKAINISMGKSFSNQQHVFKIMQVSGKPFYGYHAQDHKFLKIYFFNPFIVKRASDLLQNGAVCGTQFQVHEGHVPFILQFFIDYNLYGMSFINVKSVVYRKDGSPPDVSPGHLDKDSYCQLEADAVAVDILNRLNIEGELAVNPGLAAIWKEEKERLQTDALDSSQRPTPNPTMSEVLLMEKLNENLRFKGKYKANLKENIPYPAETQRSNTSDILNASVLDTHSVFSLAPPERSTDEMALINEELILNISQNSNSFLSMDQSLLAALESLAGPNETLCAVMSQNVEDDSILGSQMVPQTNNNCDEDAEVLEYSLPASFLNVPDFEPNSDDDSNESFEVGIPQLDGVGDTFEDKKEKSIKKSVLVRTTNTKTEYDCKHNITDEYFEDFKESNNCWPESEKPECLDEIFSDDDVLNSPTHVSEDNSCLQIEPVNIDYISSFDTVLRGDPTFSLKDSTCAEDVLFETRNNSVSWNNSLQLNTSSVCDRKAFVIVEDCNLKSRMNNNGEFPYQNSNATRKKCTQAISSLNVSNKTNVGPTANDKTFGLPLCSDDLLSTNQLDEKLDEELNIGIQIIYENSSQSQRRQCTVAINRLDCVEQTVSLAKQDVNHDEEIDSIEDSVDFSRKSFAHTRKTRKVSLKKNHSTKRKIEDEPIVEHKRKCPQSNEIEINILSLNSKTLPASNEMASNNIIPNNTSPLKVLEVNKNLNPITSTFETPTTKKSTNPLNNSKVNQSKSHLVVDLFKKRKTKQFVKKSFNSFKMSNTEIETYFSQLERLELNSQAEKTNPIDVIPFVWTPIRDAVKLSVKHNSYRSRANIKKRNRFSKQEKAKLTSCFVLLENLTQRSVDLICKEHKVKINSDLFSNNKLVIRKDSNGNSKIDKKSSGSTSCTAHSKIVCKNVDEGGLNCLKSKLPKSNKKKCKSKPHYRSNISKNSTSKIALNSIETKQVMNKKYASSEEKNHSSETNNSSVEGQQSLLSNVFVSLEKLSALSSNTKPKITIKDHRKIPNQGKDNILLPCVNMSNVETANKTFGSGGSVTPKNKMATKDIDNRTRIRKNSSDNKNLKKTQIKFDEVKNSSKYSSQTPLVLTKAYSESSEPIVLLQDNIKMSNFLSVQEKFTDRLERVNKTTETSCRHNDLKLKVKNDELSTLKEQKSSEISCSAKDMSKEAQINKDGNHSFLKGSITSYVRSCNRLEYDNSLSAELNRIDSSDSLKSMLEKDFNKRGLLKTSNKHNKAVVRKHKQPTSQLKSSKTTNKAIDLNIDVAFASIKDAKCSESTQKENFNVSHSSFIDSKYQNSFIKHPIVCVDRLNKFLFLNKSKKELNMKEKKRSMSVDNMISSFKQKRGSLVCPKVRRSTRLHSLDGAFDNSSSDDNVSDRDGTTEKPISTPKKKRPSSSKNSQTPKASYVPLDIKITKSPTVQVEHIPVLEKQSSFLKNVEPHSGSNADSESLCIKSITYDSFATIGNTETVGPCNKITKLEPKINLNRVDLPSCSSYTSERSINAVSSKSYSFEARNDIKIFTKAHPIIKKLKVNVKRLSCDTQEISSKRENICGTKKMSHRRTSLPFMAM